MASESDKAAHWADLSDEDIVELVAPAAILWLTFELAQQPGG